MRLKTKVMLMVFVMLSVATSEVLAQKRRRNKGTSKREIRKRQEEANEKSEYNKFNELQPMGHKSSQARIDYLWSYETANTVPVCAGDISLITPSRFSIYRGVEFGGSIGLLPIAPNFYLKKKWKEGKFYFSTRHQVYSYSPMLYWAQEYDAYNIFPGEERLPVTVALKNELLLSKPFLKDLKCGSVKQPFIIVTAGLAYDYGLPVEETSVKIMPKKFLKQRSDLILGGGGMLSARLQGDFYLYQNLYLTTAIRGLFGSSNVGNSIENNSHLKLMISPRFSLSAGYWFTFGSGDETPVLPFFDITYHFGNKQGREKGLFGKM